NLLLNLVQARLKRDRVWPCRHREASALLALIEGSWRFFSLKTQSDRLKLRIPGELYAANYGFALLVLSTAAVWLVQHAGKQSSHINDWRGSRGARLDPSYVRENARVRRRRFDDLGYRR